MMKPNPAYSTNTHGRLGRLAATRRPVYKSGPNPDKDDEKKSAKFEPVEIRFPTSLGNSGHHSSQDNFTQVGLVFDLLA